jgi:hypothetical protein
MPGSAISFPPCADKPMADRTAAERQRRRRERRRQGVVMRASLDIRQPTIDFMLAESWIGLAELGDPEALEAALTDLLECIVEGRLIRRHASRVTGTPFSG